jgi:hypothetical protein
MNAGKFSHWWLFCPAWRYVRHDRVFARRGRRYFSFVTLRDYEQRVFDVVTDVAGEAIRSHRAQLEIETDESGQATFTLTPSNPRACPVEVSVCEDTAVFLCMAPEGRCHEIWEPTSETQRLRELWLCLAAVLSGQYEEGPQTRTRRILVWRWSSTSYVGTFHTTEGDFGDIWRVDRKEKGRLRQRSFEPY